MSLSSVSNLKAHQTGEVDFCLDVETLDVKFLSAPLRIVSVQSILPETLYKSAFWDRLLGPTIKVWKKNGSM